MCQTEFVVGSVEVEGIGVTEEFKGVGKRDCPARYRRTAIAREDWGPACAAKKPHILVLNPTGQMARAKMAWQLFSFQHQLQQVLHHSW